MKGESDGISFTDEEMSLIRTFIPPEDWTFIIKCLVDLKRAFHGDCTEKEAYISSMSYISGYVVATRHANRKQQDKET